MKKTLFITAILIGFLGSAQDSIVKAVSLKGRGPFLVKGSMTGTTITGAQIVDSLNLELGSTDWQDGATQLSDLSDVNTSTPTNRNVLVADGVDWESRPLVEADISDLKQYLPLTGGTMSGDIDMNVNNISSGGVITSLRNETSTLVSGSGGLYFGEKEGVSGRRWLIN